MTTFVLVHGAFRGGWAWERVVPLLEAEGHRAVAEDLPGAGDRFDPDGPVIDLSACIDDLVALFDRLDLRDVVLVGHSQGGFVARAASNRLATRLRALAHLDAPVPRHGERAIDLLPGAGSGAGSRAVTEPPPDVLVPPPPVDPALGPDAEWVARRLTPIHAAVALEPVRLDDPTALVLPEHHAFCAGTPDTYPAAVTRARLDAEGRAYDVLDAPHDAPLTHPRSVSDWILSSAS